jgi:hypothetical protein
MGLIYRTSSLANVGASSIKNAELTYEEGDGNIAFLLTNLSGSNVSIAGNTTMSGPIQVNGALQIDGNVFMPQLTSASQNSVVTFDSSTGRFYYTASSAIVPTTAQFALTASFVTASNVYGPFGSNSIISASYASSSTFATSASWAPPSDIETLKAVALTVKVVTTNDLGGLYNNGTNGVGAFLSSSINGGIGAIDSVSVENGDRILLKDQADPIQNGIYEIISKGSSLSKWRLERTVDSDETSELDNQIVIPLVGTTNSGFVFGQVVNNPAIGVNDIIYQKQDSTLVTQSPGGWVDLTGNQIYKIPWWTAESRSLSKGSDNFKYVNVTVGSNVITSSLLLTGSFNISGSATITNGVTASLYGTSSWSNNALTSSFVTASNVYGPHGSSSVLSSSFAVSASWAPSTSTHY